MQCNQSKILPASERGVSSFLRRCKQYDTNLSLDFISLKENHTTGTEDRFFRSPVWVCDTAHCTGTGWVFLFLDS